MGKVIRLVAVAAVAATLLAVASPASANTSEGYVAGANGVTDDFNDEGVVDSNTHDTSWAAGMWQAILYADGAIESDGTTFDASDIDCDFGPNTAQATRSWQGQAAHNVSVDGSAGPQTWGKAGQQLSLGSLVGDDEYRVNYVGLKHTVTFLRQGVIGTTQPHAYMNAGTNSFGLFAMKYANGVSCSSSYFLG